MIPRSPLKTLNAFRFAGVALLVVALQTTSNAVAGNAEELKAVSFIPANHPLMVQPREWLERVNVALAGTVHIELVGGPEAIPHLHQVEAVRNDVVDLAFTTTSNYQDQLPEVSAFTLSRLTPTQERKSGFYRFMVDLHESIDVRYIGRAHRSPFYLYINEPADDISDLAGMKIRTGTLYNRFIRKLGMAPITIESSEVYTALERGLIDGFVWPLIGPRQYGWLEMVDYRVDVPFFDAGNIVIVMNLEEWNELSANARSELETVTAEFEADMADYYTMVNAREEERMQELGLQPLKFSAEENRKFRETAYQVEWAEIADRAPAKVSVLRSMSGN